MTKESRQTPQFDFIALGDIVTDAFIRLKEAEIHADIQKSERKICMNFGDKIPYESVTVVPAVGNSPNASVSASRLGLKSALVTNLGDDIEGDRALEQLKDDNVSTVFARKHREMKTNYHYVLWYQDDRTILIKHEEYPYTLPNIGEPKWLYLSSLGSHSLPFHHTIADYLEAHPKIRLVFQPGTFQIQQGTEKLSRLYAQTEVFFCNTDEARRLLKTQSTDILTLLRGLQEHGPKIVVITDGAKGAYAYYESEAWFMPPYPDPKAPVDRTGAGDSFASTFTSALVGGKTVPEALTWAPINSMSVVQQIGAQKGLLTREKLEDFLAKAPPEYKLKILV
ncbi:MAG: carbohydrate kinase family protein [Patescibacteria group bacterium]|nr:carbohydrate kinase family protein [Patescibacteria group bacterium]